MLIDLSAYQRTLAPRLDWDERPAETAMVERGLHKEAAGSSAVTPLAPQLGLGILCCLARTRLPTIVRSTGSLPRSHRDSVALPTTLSMPGSSEIVEKAFSPRMHTVDRESQERLTQTQRLNGCQ
jgi:hypothetical protein